LSLAGLALAIRPPDTILQIATQTFTGLAVLFPTVLFGLYWERRYALAAILSILAGESAVALFFFKILPAGPFLPVIWVMAITFVVYLAVHGVLAFREEDVSVKAPDWPANPYTYLLSAIFLAAMDFWAWGDAAPLMSGLPLWMGYFVGLSALQTAAMRFWVGREARPELQITKKIH
jgi:SSS family solute:Na+ symporter